MPTTTISVPAGSISLAGLHTTPGGPGPHPTALLLAGSGPLDRDGSIARMPLAMSRLLADVLASAGWASLRFDKRGVGASGGDYLSTGFYDELDDATAAFRWLRDRSDVGPLIIVGHSVGTLMAIETADREGGVDGAILLAATAKTGEETLAWQTRQIGDHLVPRPVTAIMRLFRTSVEKQQRKAVAKLKATTTDVARIQLAKVNAKWMREFIAYDPVPTFARVPIPLLAITGSKDVQVDPADLSRVAELAAAAEVHEVPDVDHILRQEAAPFSNPRHYRQQAAKPIDARVVQHIERWLTGRVAASRPAPRPDREDVATPA